MAGRHDGVIGVDKMTIESYYQYQMNDASILLLHVYSLYTLPCALPRRTPPPRRPSVETLASLQACA